MIIHQIIANRLKNSSVIFPFLMVFSTRFFNHLFLVLSVIKLILCHSILFSFMTMNTSLAHLPEYKQRQVREIAEVIIKAVDPEKVILFGSHATGRWVEHRYAEDNIVYEYISDYDILVITKAGDTRKDYEVQDLVENRCRYKTPVTAIVHDINFVNKMLGEGQYFFTDIEEEGIMLYDAGITALAERRTLTRAEAKVKAQDYFDQWYISGANFLELIASSNKKALKELVFILHQAAERTYNAIILVFMGYKPKTHNLDKLHRYSKPFSAELETVFPENTAAEVNLFDLLQRAYIDARYKADYSITAEEMDILIERVQKLQAIAERICQEKIASFDSNT
jgi:predicted nucleotidyltransferase/HEPN domain-containing protein